ncbi:MAG TPA: hypothetical protein VFJ16_04105 [Longimicrobium sp.]|nr:hypothetical protein [Longimicrobium sp.]
MSSIERPRLSVSRRREFVLAGLEIFVFLLTSGLLAYLSEIHSWGSFGVILFVALILVVLLTILRVGPVAAYLRNLERREFELGQRFSSLGGAKFYNMQIAEEQNDRNEETQRVIRGATVMYLLANSAASYVDPGIWRHWPSVRDRLNHGATLNILLLDPLSEDKRVRDQLNTAGEAPDSKFKFPVFIELYNTFQNVHIRFVRENVYCSLFFSQDAMFYDPYHLGRFHDRIERMFCLKFLSMETGTGTISYYAVLKRHFDALWLMSTDFEDYFDQNSQIISTLIPSSLTIRRRHRIRDLEEG